MITVMPHNVAKEPIELVEAVSKENLKRALVELARQDNIPVEVVDDKYSVGDGGFLSGLMSPAVPCIAIYHTKHKRDYYSLVIELKEAYGRDYACIHMGGKSRNTININMGKFRYGINNGEITEHRPGMIGRWAAGSAQHGLQDEELYYSVMYELIGSALAKATCMPPVSQPASAPARPATASAQPPKAAAQPAEAAQGGHGGVFFDNLKARMKTPSPVLEQTVAKAAETVAGAEARQAAYTNYKEGKGANREIVAYLLAEFQRAEGIDVSDDVIAVSRLVEAAEKANLELAEKGTATVELPFLSADANGPKNFNTTLTRDMFSE